MLDIYKNYPNLT